MLTEQDRLVAKEFEEYYSSFDPDTDRLLGLLQEHFPEDERSRFSYETKAEFYELLARECRIHLFRRSGFFFEISSGRERFTWGGLQSPVGSFFHECTASLWLNIYGEETGLKKNIIRSWIFRRLPKRGSAQYILTVCPASLRMNMRD